MAPTAATWGGVPRPPARARSRRPPLNAVWGSDATHVWAVGEGGTIVFWNGQFWKQLLSGTPDKLSAVWGSGPTDLWVAGSAGVRHFNGIAWSAIAGLNSAQVALWLSQQ